MAEGEIGAIIRDIRESVIFEPGVGMHKVVEVIFEYPPGQIRSVYIAAEEYVGPETAKAKVKEWVEKYGKALGKV
ncbi:MAG: hypothetical protein QXS32_07740 [Candidatus Nezhaarchaeales archaeon]